MKTQTSQEYNPHKKKKISIITIVLLAGLVLIVLYLAAAMGAALDLAEGSNGVDFGLFMQNFAVVIAAPNAVFSALGAGGYAPQMVFFTVVAIGIYALYKYSQTKRRLHRKGVEHGSAQWGV